MYEALHFWYCLHLISADSHSGIELLIQGGAEFCLLLTIQIEQQNNNLNMINTDVMRLSITVKYLSIEFIQKESNFGPNTNPSDKPEVRTLGRKQVSFSHAHNVKYD